MYRTELGPRLYEDPPRVERFERPADVVARTVVRAIEARRPRARYRVTVPTHAMEWARRLLPGRWRDALIARA